MTASWCDLFKAKILGPMLGTPKLNNYIGWLPVPGNLNHMFKNTNDLAPNYLSSDMIRTSDIHGHNTRKSVLSYLVPMQG